MGVAGGQRCKAAPHPGTAPTQGGPSTPGVRDTLNAAPHRPPSLLDGSVNWACTASHRRHRPRPPVAPLSSFLVRYTTIPTLCPTACCCTYPLQSSTAPCAVLCYPRAHRAVLHLALPCPAITPCHSGRHAAAGVTAVGAVTAPSARCRHSPPYSMPHSTVGITTGGCTAPGTAPSARWSRWGSPRAGRPP